MPEVVVGGFVREDLAADGDAKFGDKFPWLRAGKRAARGQFARIQVDLATKRPGRPSWCMLEGSVTVVVDDSHVELIVEAGGDPDTPEILQRRNGRDARFKATLRRDDAMENPWLLESLVAVDAS